MFRELRRLGASMDLAARIAGNARRWWRNSRMGLNMLMPSPKQRTWLKRRQAIKPLIGHTKADHRMDR